MRPVLISSEYLEGGNFSPRQRPTDQRAGPEAMQRTSGPSRQSASERVRLDTARFGTHPKQVSYRSFVCKRQRVATASCWETHHPTFPQMTQIHRLEGLWHTAHLASLVSETVLRRWRAFE